MEDYVDIFDYVSKEDISSSLNMALEDPFSVNFRSKDSDKIGVIPEDQLIRSTRVDRANQNVEIQYNPQSVEEKYIVVMKGRDLAIVESHANIPAGKYSSVTTVNYHVVTPDKDLFYDGQGYKETINRLPRESARKAPELLEKAKNLGKSGFRPASELEPSAEEPSKIVPPPQKDRFSDD